MGATNSIDIMWGYDHTPAGMKKAYEDAYADALYEYGHNPYNGTISTTNGVVLAKDNNYNAFKPMHYIDFDSDPRFYEWPEDFGAKKWGPAAAVPIFTKDGADLERKQFKITRRVPVQSVSVKKSIYDGKPCVSIPASIVNDTIDKDVRNKFRGKEKPKAIITHAVTSDVMALSSSMPISVMQGKAKISDLKRKTIEVTYAVNAVVVKSYGKGKKKTGWALLSIVAI